jgi:hypothetical protein
MTLSSSRPSVVRILGWLLWCGPIGFVFVVFFAETFRQTLGNESRQAVLGAIVLLSIAAYPAMLVHLFLVSEANWEERKQWLVWLFVGGPLTACYYLTTRPAKRDPDALGTREEASRR